MLQTNDVLAGIFAALPIPSYIKDASGAVLEWNIPLKRLLEIPNQASPVDLGRYLSTALAAADQELDQLVLLTGSEARTEVSFPVGATTRDVLLEKSPFRDSFGKLVGILSVITDMTEQKSIQRTLNHELQLRLAILECLDAAVLVADETTRSIRLANSATREVFGYEPSALIGRPLQDLHLSPEDCTRFMETATTELDHGGFRDEYLLRHADGSMVPTEISLRRVPEGYGWRSAYVYAIRDITNFKSIEQLLSRRQDELRSLLEHVPGVVVRVANDDRIVFVSALIRRLVAADPADLEGHTLPEISGILNIDPIIVGRFIEAVHACRRSGQPREAEGSATLGDRTIWVAVHVVPEFEMTGQVVSTLALIQDLSEQRSTELALRHREAQLREAQRLETVGQLAGGVAHDFNNILTAIHGYVHLLLRVLEPGSTAAGYVDQIRQAGNRAAKLTGQMLLFSRNAPSDAKPMDLNQTVNGMLKMLDRLIGERISICTQLTEPIAPFRGDEAQIEQIVMNLVLNARDAMPDGGVIEVQTRTIAHHDLPVPPAEERRGDQYVVLTVRDSGTGMDDAVVRRIFEPFFTTKEPGRGTGLGLAVVYGIVKDHRGWIDVDSVPGVGTVFHLYFPALVVDSAVEPAARSGSAYAAAFVVGDSDGSLEQKTGRILLVEDDEAVMAATRAILELQGYHVTTAASILAANVLLHSPNEPDFDVVVSDVVLSDGSGTELARTMAHGPHTPRFLFASGYVQQSEDLEFIRKHGHAFVSKPYGMTELVQLIDNLRAADKA